MTRAAIAMLGLVGTTLLATSSFILMDAVPNRFELEFLAASLALTGAVRGGWLARGLLGRWSILAIVLSAFGLAVAGNWFVVIGVSEVSAAQRGEIIRASGMGWAFDGVLLAAGLLRSWRDLWLLLVGAAAFGAAGSAAWLVWERVLIRAESPISSWGLVIALVQLLGGGVLIAARQLAFRDALTKS